MSMSPKNLLFFSLFFKGCGRVKCPLPPSPHFPLLPGYPCLLHFSFLQHLFRRSFLYFLLALQSRPASSSCSQCLFIVPGPYLFNSRPRPHPGPSVVLAVSGASTSSSAFFSEHSISFQSRPASSTTSQCLFIVTRP